MILTRPIRKHPRWFGYIGSSTTCRPIPRACPRTQARHGYRKAPYLGSMISKRRAMAARVRRSAGTVTSISLDIALDLRDATKSQIERAMRGHVLANAELIGTYQKGDR